MDEFIKVSSVSERLRTALEDLNLKQTELVQITGIDKGAISCYLSGRYEPKQMALYKIAKALCVSEMWLLGYNCPKERPIEQIENDDFADTVSLMRNNIKFRRLIIKIAKLKPDQIQIIHDMVDALTEKQQDS